MKHPPNVLATLAAAALALTLVALGEFMLLSSQGDLGGEGGSALLFTLGLIGGLGAPIILGLGLFLPPLLKLTHPGALISGLFWTAPKGKAGRDRLNRAAAVAIAAPIAALVMAAAAFMGGKIAHGFANPSFTGPFTALMALMGLVAAGLLYPGFYAATRWILDKLLANGRLFGIPSPALPLIVALAAGIFVILRVLQLDLGAYRYGGYLAVALVMLLTLPLSLIMYRLAARWALIVLLPLLGLSVGGLFMAIQGFEEAPAAGQAIAQEGHMSAIGLAVGRRLLDFDKDGASGLLGGGDCEEGNPEVGPHAREIPGNGVDDNCRGGDAPKLEPKKPASQPTSQPAEPDKPAWKPKKLNVLMLVIDTVRYDHLGLYGYHRPTSPNIDAWAKEGVVFERVYAQAPNTPRSFPSFFMGRYPSRVRWVKRFDRFSSVEEENQSVFEIFKEGGWRTEVVSSHWYWERAKGIKQGVDNWDNRGFLSIKESNTQISSQDIAERTVARLDELAKDKDKPFILLSHFFDPHSRYMYHKKFKYVFEEDLKNKKIEKAKLPEKYDMEIAYTDQEIKKVFDKLKELGLYENTIVMLFSDHGEAFGEHHRFYFHGRTVYDEELRVPMIVRMPGAEPQRVNQTIALIDLLPTLVELVGLEAPEAQGLSFGPLLHGLGDPPPKDRMIFLEQMPYPHYEKHIAGVIQGDVKAIRDLSKNVSMVFDLKADPEEKKNLLNQDKAAGAELFKALDGFLDADPGYGL